MMRCRFVRNGKPTALTRPLRRSRIGKAIIKKVLSFYFKAGREELRATKWDIDPNVNIKDLKQ